jgi:hypothetical protein
MSDTQTTRIEKARAALKASDQAIVRALEAEIMSAEWCAWRERVRAIARDGGEDVPPEPPRLRAGFNPHAEPAPVVMPEFLKAPEMPPPELADLIEYADTPVETNEKLLVRLREVLGLIGLAEDAGGRAAPDLYRRKDRLESGIRWNRGRMAETI